MLSGIAATGRLHIGNYAGAIRQWAALQDRYDCYFFIADLHALTIPENVRSLDLRSRLREIASLYIACGIDPERSTIFLQSQVPAHAILGWIFDCVTPISWLQRMTQFKSKSQGSNPSAGLLTYPALQAADILLYQANYVPVGDDQAQHVEITRDIANRFNHLFGQAFVAPETMLPPTGARIMGLDDPTVKMSKSLADSREGHALGLLDPPEKIRRAIMRAVTDSQTAIRREALSPAIENLLTLYEVLTGASRDESLMSFEGQGYGVLKKRLAEVALAALEPIQTRYREISAQPGLIDGILADGAKKAAAVANATLNRVLALLGLPELPS